MAFCKQLITWYTVNKRDLPWRNTTNPYKIWLSEIILQQTRVDQGTPYYNRFVDNFPTVHHLAQASEDEVLKLWQGLGYYSRARNLHHTARFVSEELGGEFPEDSKSLLRLKGIGRYTAAAIASFCFSEVVPVVDGNVFRVLSRYFGVDLPVNSTAGDRYFHELAREVICQSDPATYNQAIMEFGARQCKPKNPDCQSCPLSGSCTALAHNRIDELPVKIKKGSVKKRYFNYLVPLFNGETLIEKRREKGIWQNLYEFPLIETDHTASREEIGIHPVFKKVVKESGYELELYNEQEQVHKLSHQHIYARFWIIRLNGPMEGSVKKSRIEDYAMPVLLANFVREFDF